MAKCFKQLSREIKHFKNFKETVQFLTQKLKFETQFGTS